MPYRYKAFYYPDDEYYDSPFRAGLMFEEVYFNSLDNTRLWGWFIPAKGIEDQKQVKGTVIHMHGNAQNMTAHWQFAEWLPLRGYNLFTFDYRGYGKSEGTPEPKGVFEDCIAAFDHLRSRTDIDTDRLFVFGQSLGGMLAIASSAASPKGIRAVLAEAPVHSYSMSVRYRMPGMQLDLDDSYCAGPWVSKVAPIPLMLMHGTADSVVHYDHSLALYEDAGDPKQLVTIEGGEHIDAMTRRYGSRYKDMMVDFFDRSVK